MYALRVGNPHGEWTEYPLMAPAARPELLKISPDGCLKEDERYRLRLVTDSAEAINDISIVVDGEEVAKGFSEAPVSYRSSRGELLYVHTPRLVGSSENDGQILLLIYGFARIEVALRLLSGARVSLESDDIPILVRGNRESETARVEGMFDALFSAPPSKPLQWMLTGTPSQDERFSIVEGGVTSPATRSVSTFLQVTDQVLSEFERLLPSFRGHVRSSISEVPTSVPGSKVRVAGAREARWIAMHPDVLQKSRIESGIKLGSGFYMPRYVQTGQRARSYDTYENRTIVSFLAACGQRLGRLSLLIESERDISQSVEKALNPFSVDGYILSSLLIAATGHQRGEAVRERTESLRKKATTLEHAYELAVPGVKSEMFLPPRRSKVFQEVAPYTRLYELMMRWCTMGDLDMRGSLLALRTARMDRFYEYYALFSILSKLDEYGFKPSDGVETPIGIVEYSLAGASRYYRNEKQVANKYVFAGSAGTVTLYYQPVIYGDSREENGICLHRTSVGSSGYDSYYTPDFLLTLDCESGLKTVVIDAKYRYTRGVMESSQVSEFQKCLRKYRQEVSGITGPPDAVWLLCGRDTGVETRYWEQSSWAQSTKGFIRSGAMALTPMGDELDSLFQMIGILQIPSDEGPAISLDGRAEAKGQELTTEKEGLSASTDNSDVDEVLSHDSASTNGSDREEQSAVRLSISHERADKDATPLELELPRASLMVPLEDADAPEEVGLHSAGNPIQDEAKTENEGTRAVRRERKVGEKKGGAAKRNVVSGSGWRVRRDSSSGSEDLVGQIFDLLGHDYRLLFDDRWSRANIGMGRPVLRDLRPSGKEANRYVPFVMGENGYFLAKDWTPLNINKAKMLIKRLSKQG